MTQPASTATHCSLSDARAALTELLQGAVMSKFVTQRECTAYRGAIIDALAAINAAPQVLSTQDSTRTGDDIGPCARHPTEKETGGSPAVAAPSIPSATTSATRRVVCAAIRDENGNIVCGPRHFDTVMHRQLAAYGEGTWNQAEQGFVDQRGEWLSREEAHKVATEAGQIIRRCGGDDNDLYSENLY